MNLLKDAFAYTFASYLIEPVAILSALLVRRQLGPYLTGVLATLNVFAYYASFSNLGILSAAERELPYSRGAGDAIRFERIRYSVFTLAVTLGLLLGWGTATWTVLRRSTLDESLFAGLLVYAVYVFGLQWVNYYVALLRASQEFVFLSKVQVLVGVITSVGNILGVLFFGFGGVLGVTVFVIIGQAIYLIWHLGYLPPLRIDWSEAKQLFRIGVPLLISGLTITGVRTVDNILVLRWLGTEALGLYSIALLANTMIFSVTNSFSVVLFPRMQVAYGQHRTLESLNAYVVRPNLIMGSLLPLVIGAIVLGVPVVVDWMLPRFSPGVPAFKVVALGTYFFGMFRLSTSFLISLDKQLKLTLLLGGALGATVAFAYLFMRMGWGLVGMALATGIGYFICFISVNIYALSHWAGWGETAVFLRDLMLPFLYSTLLLTLLDQYRVSAGTGLIAELGVLSLKLTVFALAYVPLIFLGERKTHLMSEFVYPLTSRLRHWVVAGYRGKVTK